MSEHSQHHESSAAAAAGFNRRMFLRQAGMSAAAFAAGPVASRAWGVSAAEAAASRPAETAGPSSKSVAETGVKALFDTLTEVQKKEICFAWDYMHPERGLLRTHVSNNWHVTAPAIDDEFYTDRQRGIIADIFKSLFNADWHKKMLKQLKDDTGGREFGAGQNIAIFGTPGGDRFQFVMTGRHLTIRADGNSEGRVAFGGPIFHGHQSESFNEAADHPGNIFWPQALLANKVADMLDGGQRERALVKDAPGEAEVGFRGPGGAFPGLPVREMSPDQRGHIEKVLSALVEPYRDEDRSEVVSCLKRQGGLDACSLAFYREGDIGDDKVWDNWRLEGPSFVWYFRGSPHVHIWINVADDPNRKLNAMG